MKTESIGNILTWIPLPLFQEYRILLQTRIDPFRIAFKETLVVFVVFRIVISIPTMLAQCADGGFDLQLGENRVIGAYN